MYRLISLLIGYVFGNFLMADVVAKKYTGKKASEIGSGNPGMANVMAQCGFGAGLLVLAGDLAKTVIPHMRGWAPCSGMISRRRSDSEAARVFHRPVPQFSVFRLCGVFFR